MSLKNHFVKANIEIRPSAVHRYGVFATANIFPDDIVEECPVIVFQLATDKKQNDINDRAFFWDGINVSIPLGCGCIYNHSDSPNASFVPDHERKIMKYVATKPIAIGAEILIDYANNANFIGRIKKAAAIREKGNNERSVLKVFVLLFSLLALSMILPLHLS